MRGLAANQRLRNSSKWKVITDHHHRREGSLPTFRRWAPQKSTYHILHTIPNIRSFTILVSSMIGPCALPCVSSSLCQATKPILVQIQRFFIEPSSMDLLHKFLITARRLHTRDQKCHQPTEGKEKKKKKNSLCYAKFPQIPGSGSSSIGSIVIMHWLITEYQEQENPDYSFHQSTGFPWPLLRMISGAK